MKIISKISDFQDNIKKLMDSIQRMYADGRDAFLQTIQIKREDRI